MEHVHRAFPLAPQIQHIQKVSPFQDSDQQKRVGSSKAFTEVLEKKQKLSESDFLELLNNQRFIANRTETKKGNVRTAGKLHSTFPFPCSISQPG